MPYRRDAKDHHQVPEGALDPNRTLEAFDVSGQRGVDGRDGERGSDGYGSGDDGDRGGDAGPAEPGQQAGSIDVTLSASGEGAMVMRGEARPASGGAPQRIERDLLFGASGYYDLLARGGHGGHGGDGGRGGDGATGSRGRDATRYSSGGNGGPGGDGGDGGYASSGAPGGAGGDVHVRVDERDTAYLMLVRYGIGGGVGGDAGQNGRGGGGGSGGRGGSSYSWTESESYTDSNGNRQTRTRWRSNPGGSSGSSGSRGHDGNALVRDGERGRNGSFTIEVSDARDPERAPRRYPYRYDLRLLDFAFHSDNRDAIFEPGERVTVERVKVGNIGGMPTPAPEHAEVHVALSGRGWLDPDDGEHLALPRSLDAGDALTLDGALHLTIGDYQPRSPADPLQREEVIAHRAGIPRVRRDFLRYETPATDQLGSLTVRFPVHAEPVEALNSLSPGEATRLRVVVRNDSTGALGAASDSGRRLRLRLAYQGSELDDDHVLFIDADGAAHPLADGYEREIPRLDGGESVAIDGLLGLREGAPHYRSARLWAALELGYLDKPAALRPIQYRELDVRAAERYEPTDGADLLLVTNHRTTRGELDAWRELAHELGFVLDVFDISRYGRLDLSDSDLGRGTALLTRYAGGTMVVLDNPIDSDYGQAYPHELLGKAQLFAAAARGVNVALIGDGVDVESLVVPTHDSGVDPENRGSAGGEPLQPTPDDLVDALSRIPDAQYDLVEQLHYRLELTRWSMSSRPRPDRVVEQAHDLQQRLRRELPDRRFIVVYTVAPRITRRRLGFKRWSLGTLEVRATLDAAAGTIVSHAARDAMHEAAHVRSRDNLMTLLLARGFDEKLARLDTLIAEHEPLRAVRDADAERDDAEQQTLDEAAAQAPALLEALVDALLVDLANEQRAVLSTRWRSGLSGSELERSLPLLRQLAAFAPRVTPPAHSDAGRALVHLGARLSLLARSHAKVADWIPFVRSFRRSFALRRKTLGFIDEFVDNAFGVTRQHASSEARDDAKSAAKLASDRIERARQQLVAAYKERVERGEVSDDLETWAFRQLRAPLRAPGITTDAEVRADAASCVLRAHEYEAICERDQQARQRSAALSAASDRARASLRHDKPTAVLEREASGAKS